MANFGRGRGERVNIYLCKNRFAKRERGRDNLINLHIPQQSRIPIILYIPIRVPRMEYP